MGIRQQRGALVKDSNLLPPLWYITGSILTAFLVAYYYANPKGKAFGENKLFQVGVAIDNQGGLPATMLVIGATLSLSIPLRYSLKMLHYFFWGCLGGLQNCVNKCRDFRQMRLVADGHLQALVEHGDLERVESGRSSCSTLCRDIFSVYMPVFVLWVAVTLAMMAMASGPFVTDTLVRALSAVDDSEEDVEHRAKWMGHGVAYLLQAVQVILYLGASMLVHLRLSEHPEGSNRYPGMRSGWLGQRVFCGHGVTGKLCFSAVLWNSYSPPPAFPMRTNSGGASGRVHNDSYQGGAPVEDARRSSMTGLR